LLFEFDQATQLVEEPVIDLAEVVQLLDRDPTPQSGGNGPQPEIVWPVDKLQNGIGCPCWIFPEQVLCA
jgi:hypothetical protein